jgi:hypothetical protein
MNEQQRPGLEGELLIEGLALADRVSQAGHTRSSTVRGEGGPGLGQAVLPAAAAESWQQKIAEPLPTSHLMRGE